MLNELLIVERGAREAGVEMSELHPHIKSARGIPTLLVRLSAQGQVASVLPVPSEVAPWTLREGQQNSFPFLQQVQYIKKKPGLRPLLLVAQSGGKATGSLDRSSILGLAQNAQVNQRLYRDWPGESLLKSIDARRAQLGSGGDGDACTLGQVIQRFLLACDRSQGGDPLTLLRSIADTLLKKLEAAPQKAWADVAAAVLVEGSGAFLFDAEGLGEYPIYDARNAASTSIALRREIATDSKDAGKSRSVDGCCGLTGEIAVLVEDSFPQPNLPLLGQTFLFSRNGGTGAAPAFDRYGRYGARSMPVARDLAIRLSAALTALTSDARKGVTWRGIPGEAPKQTDLLLAFVEAAPDAPVAAALVDDDEAEEDGPREETAAMRGNSVAAFEQRTQRLVQAVRAKVETIDQTPVRYAVFRKVDPANRKVSYQGQIAVADLARAAEDWVAGERNVPQVSLPVLYKGDKKPRASGPPHVAPLGLIAFTKQIFVRNGRRPDGSKKEQAGVTAGEALGLFLEENRQRAARVLRLVLARRTSLVVGTVHAMRPGFDAAKEFDRREALRTVTILGLLLHKLGRRRESQEDYMNDAAFKLGQLLAVADIVHAGYCADVRGGDVPPSLLGNQVFGMAQTSPVKALDALGRRWKPYEGWAAKALRAIDAKANRRRDEMMRESKNRVESQRGWDITKALSVARRVRPLIDELRSVLAATPDDRFRAELLLGYVAGLAKTTDDTRGSDAPPAEHVTPEE